MCISHRFLVWRFFLVPGYCNEDEHFIVWMRAAGVQPFRKIWAKIEHTIPKVTPTPSTPTPPPLSLPLPLLPPYLPPTLPTPYPAYPHPTYPVPPPSPHPYPPPPPPPLPPEGRVHV